MHKLMEVTAEVLRMCADNADGTSRQTHAVACRPGDELCLVPLPCSLPTVPAVAILSACGHQLGQLPSGAAALAGAAAASIESLSRDWCCRVVRVMRDGTRLRTIVRLGKRPREIARAEQHDIDRLCATARTFIDKRQDTGRLRDQTHVRHQSL